MSYCVQCGVRLSDDLKKCPLCQTAVNNPNLPVKGRESDQPEKVEEMIGRMDLNYLRQLTVIITMIPALTVLLIDILDGGIAWSPYAIGALVMCWFFFAVPLVYRFSKPYPYVTLDVLALCGYLAMIAAMTDGFSWYLNIALPLLVLIGVTTLLVMLVLRRLQMRKIIKGVFLLLILSAFLITLEVILDLAVWQQVRLGWSIYSSVPFMVIMLTALYVENSKPLKEEIRRRLFI